MGGEQRYRRDIARSNKYWKTEKALNTGNTGPHLCTNFAPERNKSRAQCLHYLFGNDDQTQTINVTSNVFWVAPPPGNVRNATGWGNFKPVANSDVTDLLEWSAISTSPVKRLHASMLVAGAASNLVADIPVSKIISLGTNRYQSVERGVSKIVWNSNEVQYQKFNSSQIAEWHNNKASVMKQGSEVDISNCTQNTSAEGAECDVLIYLVMPETTVNVTYNSYYEDDAYTSANGSYNFKYWTEAGTMWTRQKGTRQQEVKFTMESMGQNIKVEFPGKDKSCVMQRHSMFRCKIGNIGFRATHYDKNIDRAVVLVYEAGFCTGYKVTSPAHASEFEMTTRASWLVLSTKRLIEENDEGLIWFRLYSFNFRKFMGYKDADVPAYLVYSYPTTGTLDDVVNAVRNKNVDALSTENMHSCVYKLRGYDFDKPQLVAYSKGDDIQESFGMPIKGDKRCVYMDANASTFMLQTVITLVVCTKQNCLKPAPNTSLAEFAAMDCSMRTMKHVGDINFVDVSTAGFITRETTMINQFLVDDTPVAENELVVIANSSNVNVNRTLTQDDLLGPKLCRVHNGGMFELTYAECVDNPPALAVIPDKNFTLAGKLKVTVNLGNIDYSDVKMYGFCSLKYNASVTRCTNTTLASDCKFNISQVHPLYDPTAFAAKFLIEKADVAPNKCIYEFCDLECSLDIVYMTNEFGFSGSRRLNDLNARRMQSAAPESSLPVYTTIPFQVPEDATEDNPSDLFLGKGESDDMLDAGRSPQSTAGIISKSTLPIFGTIAFLVFVGVGYFVVRPFVKSRRLQRSMEKGCSVISTPDEKQ